MPDPSTVAVVALASLALAAVPGPAVFYIITRSFTQGRGAGIVSVAGIHVGTLLHAGAAVLGLSAALQRSGVAIKVIKYAGAAYLIYLGISKLRDRDGDQEITRPPQEPLGSIFRQGIVVNVLNPKTGLFFLAFLPQFVEPDRGTAPVQMALLGGVFVAVAFASDATVAVVSSGLPERLRSKLLVGRRARLFAGGVYLALGVGAAR